MTVRRASSCFRENALMKPYDYGGHTSNGPPSHRSMPHTEVKGEKTKKFCNIVHKSRYNKD